MSEFVEIIDRHGRRRRARKGEVLADGERFSLPMRLWTRCCGMHFSRNIAAAMPFASSMPPGLPAGHRPGYLFDRNNALADSVAEAAYRERVQRLDAKARKRRRPDDDDDRYQETERERRQDAAARASSSVGCRASAPMVASAAFRASRRGNGRLAMRAGGPGIRWHPPKKSAQAFMASSSSRRNWVVVA